MASVHVCTMSSALYDGLGGKESGVWFVLTMDRFGVELVMYYTLSYLSCFKRVLIGVSIGRFVVPTIRPVGQNSIALRDIFFLVLSMCYELFFLKTIGGTLS